MKQKSTGTATESRPLWEALEAFARQGMQALLQRVLDEEVETLLGRRRYERRDAVDAPPGYRNGYGKPRRLSLSAGTITLRRPWVQAHDSSIPGLYHGQGQRSILSRRRHLVSIEVRYVVKLVRSSLDQPLVFEDQVNEEKVAGWW